MLLLETLFAPTMTRKRRKEDGHIVAKSSRLSEVDGRKGMVKGKRIEARIEVRSCVPRVMNHASSSPRSELERAAAVRPVREINNVICSLGSRPIHSGPKDFY